MLDSKEISNNGISLPEKVLGFLHKLLIVNTQVLVKLSLMMTNVYISMQTVTVQVWTPESVVINHLLILIMKLNLSKSQLVEPFIFITYHVSMDRMLNSLLQFNV